MRRAVYLDQERQRRRQEILSKEERLRREVEHA
jgi:hypothetical protein